MAEKSGKTSQQHLSVLRKHLQDLGTKISHGLIVDDEDLRRAIFFVDTVAESLPADAPAPAVTNAETLRTDGPTLEEYIAAGYKAENYPPDGYAERDSPGLVDFRARQREAKEHEQPQSTSDGTQADSASEVG